MPPPTAKASRAPQEQPFLRFYHSDELRSKTLAVLAALEQAPDLRGTRTPSRTWSSS